MRFRNAMKVIAGALPRPGSWYKLVQEISTSFGELCQYFIALERGRRHFRF